jgi:hypothetical protein
MDPIVARPQARPDAVEDVCQRRSPAKLAGTFGDVAAFRSFERPWGSDIGGCLITNNDALAEPRLMERRARMRRARARAHRAGYAIACHCARRATLARGDRPGEDWRARSDDRVLYRKLAKFPASRRWRFLLIRICNSLDGAFNIVKQFRVAWTILNQVAGRASRAGTGRCYLIPAALPFLTRAAQGGIRSFNALVDDTIPADSVPTPAHSLKRSSASRRLTNATPKNTAQSRPKLSDPSPIEIESKQFPHYGITQHLVVDDLPFP